MSSWLKDGQWGAVQINLAIRGQLGGYLPPDRWDDLRIELQRIYRRATGEPMATLVVEAADE